MEKYDFSTIQLVNQRILNGTVLKIGFNEKKKGNNCWWKKKNLFADEKKNILFYKKLLQTATHSSGKINTLCL